MRRSLAMDERVAGVTAGAEFRSWVREPRKLLDHARLWLHEQEVIRLNKGLAVFARRVSAGWVGDQRCAIGRPEGQKDVRPDPPS